MAISIWINIGSDYGVLPDGTKPLPEPILSFSNEVLRHSPDISFTVSAQAAFLYDDFENQTFKITATPPGAHASSFSSIPAPGPLLILA